MTYIQTSLGAKFDVVNPTVESIDIRDIAHALSNICRFAGHVPEFYSVAQHCYEMSYRASPEHRLTALLHDASEAYIGDLPKHVKQYLGASYHEMENRLMDRIAERFGIAWPLPAEVKHLDGDMLETEFAQIFRKRFAGCPVYGKVLDIRLVPMSPRRAETRFLQRFNNLTTELLGGAA